LFQEKRDLDCSFQVANFAFKLKKRVAPRICAIGFFVSRVCGRHGIFLSLRWGNAPAKAECRSVF
jgi:hypothetical protein